MAMKSVIEIEYPIECFLLVHANAKRNQRFLVASECHGTRTVDRRKLYLSARRFRNFSSLLWRKACRSHAPVTTCFSLRVGPCKNEADGLFEPDGPGYISGGHLSHAVTGNGIGFQSKFRKAGNKRKLNGEQRRLGKLCTL